MRSRSEDEKEKNNDGHDHRASIGLPDMIEPAATIGDSVHKV